MNNNDTEYKAKKELLLTQLRGFESELSGFVNNICLDSKSEDYKYSLLIPQIVLIKSLLLETKKSIARCENPSILIKSAIESPSLHSISEATGIASIGNWFHSAPGGIEETLAKFICAVSPTINWSSVKTHLAEFKAIIQRDKLELSADDPKPANFIDEIISSI
jgi:hypothetical protein